MPDIWRAWNIKTEVMPVDLARVCPAFAGGIDEGALAPSLRLQLLRPLHRGPALDPNMPRYGELVVFGRPSHIGPKILRSLQLPVRRRSDAIGDCRVLHFGPHWNGLACCWNSDTGSSASHPPAGLTSDSS